MTTVTPTAPGDSVTYFGLGLWDGTAPQVLADGADISSRIDAGLTSAARIELVWGGARIVFQGSFFLDSTSILVASSVATVRISDGGVNDTTVSGVNRPYWELVLGFANENQFFSNLFEAADTMTGGDLADDIAGMAGDDLIRGLGGDDTLDGDAGADTLEGGGRQRHPDQPGRERFP